MIITLWVLDKTWDLCNVEFFDTKSNIVANIIVNQIDLVTSVPGSEFVIDTTNLAEISYNDMIQMLGIKVATVGLMSVPVVANLYTSSNTVRQGEKVEVTSDALDAKDKESDLAPLIEYKAPNSAWNSLKAEYSGVSPFGNWKAIFAPILADTPGIYDLRVSYTNKAGNTSEVFELNGAFNVVAVPPNVVSITPSPKEKDVIVSSSITASFSQEMNKASVESSFSLTDSFGGNVSGSFVWSNDSFVFKPQNDLKYGIGYAVKIAGTAMSVNNIALDANMNGSSEGSPKDDFVWTFTVAVKDVPVVADLYTSSNAVRQGEKVTVISNALDAKEKESDLTPLIEYKAPNGTWKSLKAEYSGVSPQGSWKAIFVPTLADTPGVYDLRVSYTNKAGNTSEVFERKGAFNVVAVPPNVVSISPSSKESGVLVSSSITASFSQEMNKASVESSFSLADSAGANVSGSFVWSNNSFVFKPQNDLKYGIGYAVKIAGTAMSVNNITLDANMNGSSEGSPKDDFVRTFTIETFPSLAVELKPANKSIIKGNMVVADLVAKDVSKLGSFSFDVNFDPTILNVINVSQASFVNWRSRPKEIGESDIWLPVVVDNIKGKVTISASKTRDVGVTGTGVLATITFDTIGIGESSIDFQNVSLKNILGETIAFALLDAKLAVIDFDLFDVNKDGIVDILDFISIRPDGKADINGDGIVDILDAVALMNHEVDIKLWDTNGDGIVDINDFIKISSDNGINPDVNGDGVIDILDVMAILNGAKGAPASRLVNELGVSFPNPTNPEAWIPFKIAESNDVVIKLYDTSGQLVRTLDLGYRVPGSYITRNMAAYWDGKDANGQHVSSGIYFYNIKSGSFTATKKLIVLE